MVLKLESFGQQIRNTWEVLKCGAGEGWRGSVGPMVGRVIPSITQLELSNRWIY